MSFFTTPAWAALPFLASGPVTAIAESAVDPFASAHSEIWSNVSGGEKRGTVSTQHLHFGVALDLERLIGWRGATLRNAWHAPLGRDLSGEYVGNHLTISNVAAHRSLYLYELWLQQSFAGDTLSLRLGQLAADAEFATTEYGSLFINSAFGWPPFLSGNLPNVGPAFPKGAPGLRLAFTPTPEWTLQSAVYQGDPFADEESYNGTRWKLDSAIGVTWLNELHYGWNQQEESSALPGIAKLGIWYQSANIEDPSSHHVHSGNYGAYLIVDQMIYRKRDAPADQGIGWFCRIATNPHERNFISRYLDTGFRWKGALPGRENDELGLAFAYAGLSKSAQEQLREEGARDPGAEMLLELTYRYQCTSWCALQPDLQYVIRPGGTADYRNAVVLGLRLALEF